MDKFQKGGKAREKKTVTSRLKRLKKEALRVAKGKRGEIKEGDNKEDLQRVTKYQASNVKKDKDTGDYLDKNTQSNNVSRIRKMFREHNNSRPTSEKVNKMDSDYNPDYDEGIVESYREELDNILGLKPTIKLNVLNKNLGQIEEHYVNSDDQEENNEFSHLVKSNMATGQPFMYKGEEYQVQPDDKTPFEVSNQNKMSAYQGRNLGGGKGEESVEGFKKGGKMKKDYKLYAKGGKLVTNPKVYEVYDRIPDFDKTGSFKLNGQVFTTHN